MARDPNLLSRFELRFIDRYLVDLNGARAYRDAGGNARRAKQAAYELMQRPRVRAEIERRMAERAERTQITADRVLEELWAIATADPGEIIEYRRTCCRHCYGADHLHQRTQLEYDADLAAWERRKDPKPDDVFPELGGVGFDPRLDPNPSCPKCFGEGVEHVFVTDTRDLSEAQRKLYAGVKVTKEGIEVRMHDKVAALQLIGRHLKMFTDVNENTGPGGGPLEVTITRRIIRPEPVPESGE